MAEDLRPYDVKIFGGLETEPGVRITAEIVRVPAADEESACAIAASQLALTMKKRPFVATHGHAEESPEEPADRTLFDEGDAESEGDSEESAASDD